MLTMPSVFDRTLRLYGAETAIRDAEGDRSWADFLGRVARAAGMLASLGVRPGERYATLCRNTVRHAELISAGYWLGAVPVPINTRLAPPEMRFILEDAGCRVLAVEDTYAGLVRSEAALAPWRDHALLVGAETAADAPWPRYEAELARAEALPPHEAREDDDAILLYTGGTTGRSKGVRLTHRNVVANGLQVAYAQGTRTGDCFLHVAPMFHSADLLGTAYTLCGAAHAYLPQFGAEALLDALAARGVTATMLTPTMIIMTLQQGDPGRYDLSRFRLLFYGSSPMAAEWTERAMRSFPGAALQQGYGLTETSPILTTLDPELHRRAIETGETAILRSVGRPVAGVDMRIVGDDGGELARGQAGEVAVRGPNVTPGYLNRPEETERAFNGGWFHTGDVGRMDQAGFLYLLDRKKDMVITGGENVYTSEVEAVLYAHADVHECAVVGVPDERWGEALFAVIVPRPGAAPSEEALIAHCRRHIGGYKIPRRMAFVPELPKSAMGKILKTELRRIYGGDAATAG